MNYLQLIDLINGDKTKLKKWFEEFDRQSNSINDWQKLLGYPLEPHSCQICHQIRNNILLGLGYLDKDLKGLSEISFERAIDTLIKGETIRHTMIDVYPKIVALIYT
jgi:hypothetical protein